MAVVQAKLDEAQAQFDAAMAQKQRLEDDAAATQKKMDGANALIGALAGEESRWTTQSKQFDQTIQALTGAHPFPPTHYLLDPKSSIPNPSPP